MDIEDGKSKGWRASPRSQDKQRILTNLQRPMASQEQAFSVYNSLIVPLNYLIVLCLTGHMAGLLVTTVPNV